jgi:hypothetical protein
MPAARSGWDGMSGSKFRMQNRLKPILQILKLLRFLSLPLPHQRCPQSETAGKPLPVEQHHS